jgi:hypothetical protein
MPGGVDPSTRMDHSILHVGVIAANPDDDWALYEFCRQVLLAYELGGTVVMADQPGSPSVLVDSITELQGPEQIRDINPQLRLTPGTFHLVLRRPRSVPDYRVALGIN